MCECAVLLLLLGAPASGGDPPCGVLTMYVALHALDAADETASLDALWTDLGRSAKTHSLADLARVAESRGYVATGVKTSLDHLTRRQERFVCIARTSESHFLIIQDVDSSIGKVRLIDPPNFSETPYHLFAPTWQGQALLISKKPILSEAEVARLPRVIGDDGKEYQRPYSRWLWGIAGMVVAGLLATRWALWRLK